MRTKKEPAAAATGTTKKEPQKMNRPPTSECTTPPSLRQVRQKAADLIWSLAEYHLDRCEPDSSEFCRHFWQFVRLICLEDELRQEVAP